MSLLIQNMDMSNSCKECRVCSINFDWFNCPLGRQADGRVLDLENHKDEFIYTESRHPDCPLKYVTSIHGRLIDEDDVLALLKTAISLLHNKRAKDEILTIMRDIKILPTVIEAEG